MGVENEQSTAEGQAGVGQSGQAANWSDLSGPEDLGADEGAVSGGEVTETPVSRQELSGETPATPVQEEGKESTLEEKKSEGTESVTDPEKKLVEEEKKEEVTPQGLSPEQLAQIQELLKGQQKPAEKTPEQLAAEQAEFQRQENERLAHEAERLEKEYAIPDEDVPALIAEPEKVLPKLAARMHMQVMENVRKEVDQMMVERVPVVMQQHQEVAKKNSDARSAFYKANPDLEKHEQTVLQIGQVYRTMNPKATPADAIKAIGDLVRVSLGLPLQGAKPSGVTPPVKPAGVASPPTKPTAGTPAKGESGGVDWGSLVDED